MAPSCWWSLSQAGLIPISEDEEVYKLGWTCTSACLLLETGVGIELIRPMKYQRISTYYINIIYPSGSQLPLYKEPGILSLWSMV